MAAERQKRGLSIVPEVVADSEVAQYRAHERGGLYPTLPAGLEMERLWREARMGATRGLGERAISEVADIQSFASYQAAGTLQMAALLRQATKESGFLTPEMEPVLAHLALSYIQTTVAIVGVVSAEMVQTVRELSERSRTPGVWDTVVLWLQTHQGR